MLRIAGLQVLYFASHSPMIRSSRKCPLFILHSYLHSFSLSPTRSPFLSARHAQSVFSVCWLSSVFLVMCVCFLHKILRTRRFYKTLPWNNVLYAARRPIARKIHRGRIPVGEPPSGPHSARVHSGRISSRSVLSMYPPPPSAIHLPLISFILHLRSRNATDSHPYRDRMQRECPRSTLSTAIGRPCIVTHRIFFESKRYECTLRADIVGSRLTYKINVGKIEGSQPEALGCPFDQGC